MPKYKVWRSGSGHVNCWNTLPIYCGEYDADTFLDACVYASSNLEREQWVFNIQDGVLYIESDDTDKYGHKLGRYGFFNTQEAAMEETMKRFSSPQLLVDSIGNEALVAVKLSPSEIEVQYLL